MANAVMIYGKKPRECANSKLKTKMLSLKMDRLYTPLTNIPDFYILKANSTSIFGNQFSILSIEASNASHLSYPQIQNLLIIITYPQIQNSAHSTSSGLPNNPAQTY